MTRRPPHSRISWLPATRAALKLAAFAGLTLPLMPVQWLFLKCDSAYARTFPHWYHRQVCRILGLRVHVGGEVAQGGGVLLVSNHTSWLDIVVLSAVAPVSFVAKKEVGTWPLVASLALLQRSIFIDRTRRAAVADTASEMLGRLAGGDTLVLFAEGTSSDGNRVLPFQSSLFAVAKPSKRASPSGPMVFVQTIALVYTHLHGLPLGRDDRPHVGWYGDMEMGGHAWALLQSGPLDARIEIGAPVPLDAFSGRKELARHTEAEIRSVVASILRGRRDLGLPPHAASSPPAPSHQVENSRVTADTDLGA